VGVSLIRLERGNFWFQLFFNYIRSFHEDDPLLSVLRVGVKIFLSGKGQTSVEISTGPERTAGICLIRGTNKKKKTSQSRGGGGAG